MLRRRLTFSNVVSFLALFVALSAGSYAAIKLPANSVGAKQLKSKAVTSSKLAANAVDASKVKDGSLTGADLNLTGFPKVPSAATADTAGSAAIARVKQVTAVGSTNGGTVGTATAVCDPGLVVIGGGAKMNDEATGYINDVYPDGAGAFTAHAFGDPGNGFTVYAICAPAAATQ
jgi:hypothetical protein